MCGCKSNQTLKQPRQYIKTVGECKPIEYYQDLLVNLITDTQEKILLKSLLTSQINIYNKDCMMFAANIEDLK